MKFGIIAAMKIEADKIDSLLTDARKEICGGIEYTIGKLGKHDVVCAVCGIGKVFAAMCAEAMIVKFSPDVIINTGVGGTLTKELGVGDVAISSAVVQHDMDTSAIGDPVGLISGINVIEIPAEHGFSSRIENIAAGLAVKTKIGVIASGDRFVADRETKDYIIKNFGAVACEMEGGAVGQVCYVNKIPFVVIRAISDDAEEGACGDYPAFAASAAEKSAKLVVELIKTS